MRRTRSAQNGRVHPGNGPAREDRRAEDPAEAVAGRLALHRARPPRTLHAGRLALTVVSLTWLRELNPDEFANLCARRPGTARATRFRGPRASVRRLERIAGDLAVGRAVQSWHARHAHRRVSTRDIRVDTLRSGLRSGKPFVSLPVGVSLSHSGDFAVAACGPGIVGVDLERNRPVGPCLASLLALDDSLGEGVTGRRLRTMSLPLRWACKEAVLKYFGFGLRFDPREVQLTGWRPDNRFTWTPGSSLAAYTPRLGEEVEHWAYDDLDGYCLALVWRRTYGS
ncbi:hypothetical protein NGM36_04890 [Streptomyces mutabilis]|uniref:4'-phosphopantetheinyl transferase family protein n=1 Tax=Streptomyces mutabilis TaxID=67332 RepID=UPI0022BA625B|nr:hypothetical protein [Streptomyces mutabilis]MCZ9349135.1 hypothetical protein [Streptomyces mutabilis]